MSLPITTIFALLAGGITAVAAVVAYRCRPAIAASPATVFLAVVSGWSFAIAAEMQAGTLGGKVAWLNLQYIAVVLVPVCLVWFVAELLGYEHWRRPRRLVLLATPLILLALLSWTNDVHGLIRTGAEIISYRGEDWLVRDLGHLWWVGWLYSQVLIAGALIGLVKGLLDSPRGLRLQFGLLVAGLGLPWLAQGVLMAELVVFRPELLFSVTGLVFVVAVAREQLFDVVPVAPRTVVESLPHPVIVIDGTNRVVDRNPAAVEWFPELESVPVTVSIRSSDSLRSVLEDDPETEEPLTIAVDDSYRSVQIDRIDLPGIAARNPGEAVVIHDVSGLKAQRERLATANDQLESFASAMGHDLRNALLVADGYLDLVRADPEAAVEPISEAHGRMQRVLGEFSTAIDAINPDPEPNVAIEQTARRAWADLKSETGTLTVDGTSQIVADSAALERLFRMLFDNANRHAGLDPELVVECLEQGFVVSDDGPGIPPENHKAVFDLDYVTDDGTGIGLPLVKTVAAAHEWSVALGRSRAGGLAVIIAISGELEDLVAESDHIDSTAPRTIIREGAVHL